MPKPNILSLRPWLTALAAALASIAVPTEACTIFVLTDASGTLFCNNEDWFNRSTRLWFVPAGEGHLGCAYVGFDDGWAQGGMNSEGLAFDWWASGKVDYSPEAALRPVRGNPAERMLESCSTVDEAVAFFRTFREPGFANGRILVADRTGASVAIYGKDGAMVVEKLNRRRGIGYGRAALDRELPAGPSPTLENGARVLRACFQPGDGGTKYSNVFDLRAGTLAVFPSLEDAPVTLDLKSELEKGGHYYDIPQLRTQVGQPRRELLPNMQRFYLDRFKPLAEQDQNVVDRLRAVIADATAGRMKSSDYAPALWSRLAPMQNDIRADMQRMGELRALALVESTRDGNARTYRCLADFSQATVLGRYDIDAENRIIVMRAEFVERK